MAKYCEICGKGVMSGNNVSHSKETYQNPLVAQCTEGKRYCKRYQKACLCLHFMPEVRQGAAHHLINNAEC